MKPNQSDSFKFIYGPVLSRRLGLSLGVDLVPSKTCDYNCIYCQLGPTKQKVMKRKEYQPTEKVLKELEEVLKKGISIDYITFSGSGEPTLHSGIDRLIHETKKITSLPVAVVTNGSLLFKEEVRESLLEANLVVPSLDGGDKILFRHINRPHPSIKFEDVIEGLTLFRRQFSEQIWLEVFLLEGVNAIEAEIRKMMPLFNRIAPDRIQLNTAVRPTAKPYVIPCSRETMREMKNIIGDQAEIISSTTTESVTKQENFNFLDILQRRPCTLEELISVSGLGRNQVIKSLESLRSKGLLEEKVLKGAKFYSVFH